MQKTTVPSTFLGPRYQTIVQPIVDPSQTRFISFPIIASTSNSQSAKARGQMPHIAGRQDSSGVATSRTHSHELYRSTLSTLIHVCLCTSHAIRLNSRPPGEAPICDMHVHNYASHDQPPLSIRAHLRFRQTGLQSMPSASCHNVTRMSSSESMDRHMTVAMRSMRAVLKA